jgi:enamine deaminase RidA (YjgF/YER057c/UK114 family)
MSGVEDRLLALGLIIPPLPKPGGRYVAAVRAGSLLYLSGAIGTAHADGQWSLPYRGKVGLDLTVEQAYQSARLCALNHIAAMKHELGDLGRVQKIVKLTGYVNAAPGFTKAPFVLDGASDLLVEAFGEAVGLHARTATYQPEMSFNAPLETDLIVSVQ